MFLFFYLLKDISLDLSSWIGQSVVSFVGRFVDDSILDSDGDLDKDIVFCFGFANDVDLLNAQGQASGDSFEWTLDAMTTGPEQLFELTEIFQNSNLNTYKKMRVIRKQGNLNVPCVIIVV